MAKDKNFELKYKAIGKERSRLRKYERSLQKKEKMKCSSCGADYGFLCIDPYYNEINNTQYKVRLCGDCYDSSLGDI
jgi:hypothetical protein